MAKLTISAAAKRAGIARQNLYANYINTGRITVEADDRGNKCIDTAEIIRVFGSLQSGEDDSNGDTYIRHKVTHEVTPENDPLNVGLQSEVKLLREQLAARDDQIRELRDDKTWFKAEVEKLTDTIRQIEHKPEAVQPTQPAEPEYRPSWIVRVLTKRLW